MSENEEIRELKDEIDRFQLELEKACDDRLIAAQYGLEVLSQKESIQQYDELESHYESTKHELECAKQVTDE